MTFLEYAFECPLEEEANYKGDNVEKQMGEKLNWKLKKAQTFALCVALRPLLSGCLGSASGCETILFIFSLLELRIEACT